MNTDAAADAEVLLTYTYRVLVQQRSHVLALDFGQLTKGVQVELTYAGTGIRHVNILDYLAGPQPSRIERSPASVPTPSVAVGFDGWLLPTPGVAFSWMLEGELAELQST